MDKDILLKRIDKYEKLAQKNYYYYQESGEPRYDKAYEKYDELAEVYKAAYKYQSEHDESLARRLRNMSSYIEEYIEKRSKNTYSKDEVLDLADKLKQFVF